MVKPTRKSSLTREKYRKCWNEIGDRSIKFMSDVLKDIY